MEILITIYSAINIFIGGMVFSQCLKDGDSKLSTFAMTILFIALAIPIVIILGSWILIGDYIYKKNNLSKK
jgi:ABC-type sugar transport system permease subunit